MKKNVLAGFYAFLATILFTTSALAGGSVKLSGATFYLGSLIANGTLSGLGKTDVTVVLDASGIPAITCTNFGNNPVPGQSSPKISASGNQDLDGNSPLRKNGKTTFGVETVDPEYIAWNAGGCPNANWSAHVDFIYWTNATLRVYDTASSALLLEQKYACTTTRFPASVSCTPLP